MATRANIKIKNGESNVLIYRHWDGNPEVTGEDIKDKIWKAKNIDSLVVSLLEDDSYRMSDREMGSAYSYELENLINRNGDHEGEVSLSITDERKKINYFVDSYELNKKGK